MVQKKPAASISVATPAAAATAADTSSQSMTPSKRPASNGSIHKDATSKKPASNGSINKDAASKKPASNGSISKDASRAFKRMEEAGQVPQHIVDLSKQIKGRSDLAKFYNDIMNAGSTSSGSSYHKWSINMDAPVLQDHRTHPQIERINGSPKQLDFKVQEQIHNWLHKC